jgi:hypothetical protein
MWRARFANAFICHSCCCSRPRSPAPRSATVEGNSPASRISEFPRNADVSLTTWRAARAKVCRITRLPWAVRASSQERLHAQRNRVVRRRREDTGWSVIDDRRLHRHRIAAPADRRLPKTIVKLARLDHALQMVRTYLADCAYREVWGDPRMAELNEVIRSCVECISVNRRGHGQGSDARVPQEALRHALGYVDEHSDASASDDLVDGRAAG